MGSAICSVKNNPLLWCVQLDGTDHVQQLARSVGLGACGQAGGGAQRKWILGEGSKQPVIYGLRCSLI